ncbi:MAG TPA: hypothetical protein VJT67_03470, partial [Longimicrobiaceae bacterium]|nr:hypothetical protein [Longimicrobiaceae bacterium]
RWPGAAFRRGPRSEALHRELAAPFTASTDAHVPGDEPLALDQVLTLATPVHLNGGATVRPDHVFHPFPVTIPPEHREAVAAILAAMREEPAVTVERLVGVRLDCMPEAFDALEWMIGAGLVLRSRALPGWLDPASVDARLAETAFAVADVDRAATDFIVYR